MIDNKINAAQEELDEIFSLLIMSLVYKDWQSEDIPREKRRGYNIGALLVDPQNIPVYYALNCVNSTNNSTQHGELRAITQFMEKNKLFNLGGYTIYTTLEPCIMCAGMITMTNIARVVYIQSDIDYSHAFERLALDTRDLGGFPPYPRVPKVSKVKLEFGTQLDQAYRKYLQTEKEKILAKFLVSRDAKEIFKISSELFINFQIQNGTNTLFYNQLIHFFNKI